MSAAAIIQAFTGPPLSKADVANRQRVRSALRAIGSGAEQLRGEELEIVANALESDHDALQFILGRKAVLGG